MGIGEPLLRLAVVRGAESLQPPEQAVEARGRDRLVARVPPDGVAARRLLDEELVLGGGPGVLAGLGSEGARRYDHRLLAPDGVLAEGGRGEVAGLWGIAWSPSNGGALGRGLHAAICLAGTLRSDT